MILNKANHMLQATNTLKMSETTTIFVNHWSTSRAHKITSYHHMEVFAVYCRQLFRVTSFHQPLTAFLLCFLRIVRNIEASCRNQRLSPQLVHKVTIVDPLTWHITYRTGSLLSARQYRSSLHWTENASSLWYLYIYILYQLHAVIQLYSYPSACGDAIIKSFRLQMPTPNKTLSGCPACYRLW